jgi:hypothetical protein
MATLDPSSRFQAGVRTGTGAHLKKAAGTLAGVLVVALAECALRVAGATMPSNLDAAGT